MKHNNEQASGSDAGAAREGRRPRASLLSEVLAREGAPWRPFRDQGRLIESFEQAQPAKTLVAAGEKPLLAHLKAVCLWPEKERNQNWRVGDFSYYVLSFEPVPGAVPAMQVYVQFRSEPDEQAVIFEVSSGKWNPPADQYVDRAKRELLRDHGFEIGGQARNFRKVVAVQSAKDLKGLAREALAILANVLGWNGTQPLSYELGLESGSKAAHVLEAVSPETLEKLMHEWGFPAQIKPSEGKEVPFVESRGPGQGGFGIAFGDPSDEAPGEYQALRLRTYRVMEDADAAEARARHVNRELVGLKCWVDDDGDLGLETVVLLHGGVTAGHLKARMEVWRWALGEVGRGAE